MNFKCPKDFCDEFKMSEGAHWGEDDWEACEVTFFTFSDHVLSSVKMSFFENHNLFC